jgi:hypothetical protein
MAIGSSSSSARPVQERWPLLRKLANEGPWPLLLVVHGHSGGVLPQALEQWLAPLEAQRGAPVWIQALTAEPLALPQELPLLMVPLLLTPGSHVRQDLPAIRQRLRGAGHRLVSLPFLGAWEAWLEHLADLAQADPSACLLHHPLRVGLADRYLQILQERLQLPPLTPERFQAGEQRALPLALAPNRMTAQLQDAGVPAPALLERPITQTLLFNLLLTLP